MKIRKSARMDRNQARGKYRPTLERLEKREVFATLSGVVFHDLNGDGVRAADEPGLAGWTVHLETDRNNVLDPADRSMQTDENGAYAFDVPDEGPYVQFLGVNKPSSASLEEWTPTTDVYGALNHDPARIPSTVLNFGMRLNSLGNLTRVAGEVLVNTNTEGAQGLFQDYSWYEGDILDTDDAGNYVVGWSQVTSVPADGLYTHSGFVRIFNADGTPRTGAIPLGTTTSTDGSYVSEPFIAISGDGTRIATSFAGVVRVFGSLGQSIGGPVVANPYTKNEAYTVTALDMDHNGDFVVVSTGTKMQGNWANRGITVFQRYNASGLKVGNRVQVVDAYLENGVQEVAMDAAGNFLVTWTDRGLNGQRFSASGGKLGSQIKYTPVTSADTAVSMLPNGQYALVWQERETINNVTESRVMVRRFQPDGTPLGPAVLVNNHRMRNDIALDADGTIRVAWAAHSRPGITSAWLKNAYNVYMKSISPAGVVGDAILVNSTWEGRQSNAHITSLKNGKMMVAWSGRGEGDTHGVFTQRFELATPVTPSQSMVSGTGANDGNALSPEATDLIYAQLLEEELDPKGRNKRSINPRA
ncbi:SdrD B-like domain-containing protein [Pirellulaceae bacterium SH501]